MATFDSNVTLAIELGFGSGPLAASPSWTDVSSYGRGFDIRRGRASVDATFQAGTAVVLLDNRDGRFDPNNSSSPYSPNVELGVPVKITATYSATPYVLFYGHVDAWPLSYPEQGKDAVVSLSCVENQRLISGYDLAGTTYSAESSDTRVGNVLDDVGWPAGARNLDTGIVSVAASTFDSSETALTHLHRVAEAEQGSVFVDRTGDFVFYNRIQFSGGPASGGTYGPADLNYTDVGVAYDDDYLVNRAVVDIEQTGTIENTQAEDATSIADYGPRTYTTTNNLITAPEGRGVAEWIVGTRKDMLVRVESMTLKPQSDPTNLWPKALALDLQDAITVKIDPPGAGTNLDQLVAVNSIAHSVRPKQWVTSVTCSPLSDLATSEFWILGTSNDLGTDTVLA